MRWRQASLIFLRQRPTRSGHELSAEGGDLLQRTAHRWLETPFEVFDQGVFTPNDRFYVRWHLANIPSSVDPAAFDSVFATRGKPSS